MSKSAQQSFPEKGESVYDDGYFRVEHDHYYVACGGEEIPLMRKAFLIISHLTRNLNRFVPAADIWCSAWGADAPLNNNTFKIHLHRVRRLLEPFDIRIETKVNTGYRLILRTRGEENGSLRLRPAGRGTLRASVGSSYAKTSADN
jgi:DNA-binding response OmpR family regulator